jgi:hypothetical protein
METESRPGRGEIRLVGELPILARKGPVCKAFRARYAPAKGPVVRNFSIVTQLPQSLYSTLLM